MGRAARGELRPATPRQHRPLRRCGHRPELTLLPQIEANGMIHMAGFFPSVPTQVNFELAYAPAGGRWRLFALSVSFGQAAPTAPQSLAPRRASGIGARGRRASEG